MARCFIFQVNPQTQHKLSDALDEMVRQNAKVLLLSPNPETNENLKCGDVVYLWESASRRPTQPAHLAARGEVTQTPTTPMDMPTWQRTFCVDKATGQSGPQFHRTVPRAKIVIERRVGNKVDRGDTDGNPTLKKNYFLRKRGFYTSTIIPLTPEQAKELDVLVRG